MKNNNTATVNTLSGNLVDITMECGATCSSTVKTSTIIPLSPKEINEKYIPYHPTPKLCRQRVNVFPNPKKLDFDQPEENSEQVSMNNSDSTAVITPTNNLVDNENECSENESLRVEISITVPLCPISHENVKTTKEVYERHIPYHRTPKLRRQRVKVLRNPKKLDFVQPEEDSE